MTVFFLKLKENNSIRRNIMGKCNYGSIQYNFPEVTNYKNILLKGNGEDLLKHSALKCCFHGIFNGQ
jgi:hypothetical protein